MRRPIPGARRLLRKYFVMGVFVLAPFLAVGWILLVLLRALWSVQTLLPQTWRPETLLTEPTLVVFVQVAFTISAALTLALGISLIGWLSRQLLGRKLIEFLAEGIIQKIPVLRSIYSALDQLLKTVGSGSGQQFNRVVYVEYPRAELWTLAFVTSEAHAPVLGPRYLNLFVPTTPNPTSGFYLLAREQDVRESGLSVEEAFKVILSLGIAQPGTPQATRP